MFGNTEIMRVLNELLTRMVRLESRVCQLMYHVGTKPEGASPPRNDQAGTGKGN